MAGKTSGIGESQHRLTLRFSESDYSKLQYWAEHAKVSVNEFIILMLEQWIDIQNGNYELPTLEIQRLNQLISAMSAMSGDMRNLVTIVTTGFDSLTSLTRGSNYLFEQADADDGMYDGISDTASDSSDDDADADADALLGIDDSESKF